MLYRPHAGSWEQAIEKMATIPPTVNALLNAIREAYRPMAIFAEGWELVVNPRPVYDARKPWEAWCYIVHVPEALSWINKGAGPLATVGVLGYVNRIPVDYKLKSEDPKPKRKFIYDRLTGQVI
jgi:hypothetical protein